MPSVVKFMTFCCRGKRSPLLPTVKHTAKDNEIISRDDLIARKQRRNLNPPRRAPHYLRRGQKF